MMRLILFDRPEVRTSLLPLTFTRSIADLRVGILTLKEKWNYYSGLEVQTLTDPYLQPLYPLDLSGDCVFVDSSVLPDSELWSALHGLSAGQALICDGELVAVRRTDSTVQYPFSLSFEEERPIESVNRITHSWHLFVKNGAEISKDYALLTADRTSAEINDPHTIVYNGGNIFSTRL